MKLSGEGVGYIVCLRIHFSFTMICSYLPKSKDKLCGFIELILPLAAETNKTIYKCLHLIANTYTRIQGVD